MENPNNLGAIEWLEKEMLKPNLSMKDVLEQAKDIFKQQVIEAGNTCAFKQSIHSRKVDLMTLEELEQYAKEEAINVGQEYYNETFLKK